MRFWVVLFAAFLALSSLNAEAARRLGGGTSIGKQSSNVTQRQAAPPPPAVPAQNAANVAPRPAAPAAPPPQAPKRPWGAMLGGLAAGLGLAWLAHSMGLGEGFGQILMFGLLALGVVMLIGWFRRSRPSAQSAYQPGAFAFQGAVNVQPPSGRTYEPKNVGNDASARPWERSAAMPVDAAPADSGSMIGSALSGTQAWGIPAGFDSNGFLQSAKANFVSLQAAWDRADIASLRAMMTQDMLREIQGQLAQRESQGSGAIYQTEVMALEARLLGIEELADEYMASVEFSGMMREEPSTGPGPFREVWNMTRAKTGVHGWLIAGVQALQ